MRPGRGEGEGRFIFEDCVHKGSVKIFAPGFGVFYFNFKKHLLI